MELRQGGDVRDRRRFDELGEARLQALHQPIARARVFHDEADGARCIGHLRGGGLLPRHAAEHVTAVADVVQITELR